MYELGLKLWSINTDSYLKEAENLYNQHVYDYIELYVVPESLDQLSLWKKLKIPYIIHHPHFAHGFNLAKKEKEQSNFQIYQEVKKYADELNADTIIFHAGIDGNIEEVARQLSNFNESRTIIENKPFIALSNRMGGQFCRGSTFAELKYVLDNVGCGFCLDIGHAICSANSQEIEPYTYIKQLNTLNPRMYHLSDVIDMTSPYDAHPHLGTGNLDFHFLRNYIFPDDAVISVETNKDSKTNLDDFVKDMEFLKNV